MYTRLGRRADLNRPDGVRARQKAVDRHTGGYGEFLRRHVRAAEEAAEQGIEATREMARHLFKRTHDTRNLRCAWDYLSLSGGQAPGPSGLTYHDLNEAEIWQLCRDLSREIKAGEYRPGPDRKVKIPKPDGIRFRTLRLQDIEDRIVQRAIVQIVQPLLDPRFDDRSHGFRPSRHRNHALVQAEYMAASQQRWVWTTEDIRDAFEHVPHERLLDLLGRTLPEKLRQLIRVVIRNGRTSGLRQGGPLSPLLLNCYLDHFLDRPWRNRHPDVPLIRYADDLLLLCRSEPEAHEARADLESLLRPTGMSLKGTTRSAARGLDVGQPADWLGFRITRDQTQDQTEGQESLVVRIAESAWNQLDHRLANIQQLTGEPEWATEVATGWIVQQGPCYPAEDRPIVYQRVSQTRKQHGYEDVLGEQELPMQWQRAYARYCLLRSRITPPPPQPSWATSLVMPGSADLVASAYASASSSGSAAPF